MTMSSKPQHAGVHYPPPLIYVAGIVIGSLLQRWRPLPITAGPSMARMAGAVLALAIYLAFFGPAFAAFRRARTTIIPNRPAAAFVTTGPYRITRNPMYVSLVALYLAVTLFMNSWWPVALLPLVVMAIDRLVIAKEERYLSDAFPIEYAAYRSRVRRWL
jgi:protein-S-isoprenylcysteine O-methyltransferase Ste14